MPTVPHDARLGRIIGRVLLAGVAASSAALAFGLALSLAPGFDAAADWLMNLGLVMLIATPAGRVVVSIIEYLADRDWLFAMLTLIVLAELVASVVAARR